ncbi:hypothetical protein BB987_01305 [Photorhabdus temperata]|uniref:DUF6708 domain-containing protein n=1 Tax=Photorhabdus khanii NC19 TaxID=1004151 RepID=W3V6Q6_9GAMM|nr:DUF6708 domain-containing protein [Photorhabdus khanii]ETS30719.1 hypothetical protein PTE_02665 [Photorhabdus khanii NC19]OHV55817.1 hypothetical protein BB987_01305 [Photorhabdus temperata]
MQGNGLYNPYKLNRPLTWVERHAQLYQGKPTQITGKYGLYIVDHDTVIRMNSTYMETVDKYYREQGFVSSLNAVVFCCFLGMALYFTGKTIYLSILNGAIKENILIGFMITIPVTVFILYFSGKLILKEWFSAAHYPIRFNRKTQMIHVYRFNGTILSVPWKEVFFTRTIGKGKWPEWSIEGHILADDQETVLETFSLGLSGDLELMPGYWEFIRCYMEEDGLQEQADIIILCPPIEKQKESYIFGLQYIMRMNARLEWFFGIVKLPFDLITSVARYIAMQTSKMPQWPQEVEEACQVDPDDPINVSAANNPVHLWHHILANQTLEEYQAINDRPSSAHKRLQEKIAMAHSTSAEA